LPVGVGVDGAPGAGGDEGGRARVRKPVSPVDRGALAATALRGAPSP
jgi:hypothetical protein